MSDLEDIVAFALSRPPDVPGVGRLCQELLSHTLDLPITAKPPPALEYFPKFGEKGKTNNPWGRWGKKGKPSSV